MSKKRVRLEEELYQYRRTMELIRTIIPILVLILQLVVLLKLL